MGWYKSRTKLWFGDKAIIDYYKGTGRNNGSYLYQDGTNGWTVAPSLQHNINVSGISNTFIRQNGCYYGKSWFSTNNAWYLWYDGTKWILMQSPRFVGYIPITDYRYYGDDEEYIGDTFWTCTNFNEWAPDGTVAGTFVRYDDNTDVKTATSNYFHQKKKSNPETYLGEYENDEYCGYPVWKGTVGGTEYTFAKNVNNAWWNIQYININRVGPCFLNTNLKGYIVQTLGLPTHEPYGFWISQTEEPPKFESGLGNEYIMRKVHFVPDEDFTPEHPYGDIEDMGEYFSFSFDGFKDSYYTSEMGDTTQIWMAEGAIWR